MIKAVEIKPVNGIDAVVSVPGSKSYTQRALVIAALAEGLSTLSNILISEDTSYLMEALTALGADIRKKDDAPGALTIRGTAGCITPASRIHLGNNGTAMRFLATLAALGQGEYCLTGDPRLCERPIGPLLKALKSLGVDARSEREDGCPPVLINANGLSGGEIHFKNIESSQFVSSLLIAAPYAREDLQIVLEGHSVSLPYIEMTLDIMTHFGAVVEKTSSNRFFVSHEKKYKGAHYEVEGDVSSASYFMLAAALCGGTVQILNVNRKTKQGDIGMLHLMESLGCSVTSGPQWIELSGHALHPGDLVIDMKDMPDMVPTLAVLAAFRPGRTQITNAAHLRLKESNRIEALVNELRRIGVPAEETPDGLAIEGGKDLHGAEIETYDDHRIAMSFAIAGLKVPGIKIRNRNCVAKSFPGFWEELGKIVNSK